MESNKFDKEIREKLQNLEAQYKPEDWELMEQKLDGAEVEANPEFEDVLLDGIAYGSLENYKAEFDSNHWDLMEQKLDDQAYPFRRKLYRYKVAEVGLMLLAIFTLIQFLPFKKNQTSNESSVVENHLFGNDENATTSNSISNLNNEKSSTLLSRKNATAANGKASNKTNFSLVDIDSPTNTTGNFAGNTLNTVPEFGLMLKNDSANKEELNINIPIIPIVESNYFIKRNLDLSISNHFDFESHENQPVSLLLPINTYKPDRLNAESTSSLPDCPSCTTISSGVIVSVGMMGGADADYITTPFDDEYHQNEFGQIAMGYSGGLTLGFRYHKWELETGAIYAAKYYGARNIFEVNGSFSDGGYVQEGLLGVQLDLVKVPLHLRYNFMNQSKWNIYAHSGASFNVTVETLYEYTSQTVGNSNAFIASRRGDPHASNSYNGVLEGGNLIDNTFITANLGFGIERYFNSRMSIFLGSTYQHQITKGLGPQNDKINSLSIMTGARVTLKSKK